MKRCLWVSIVLWVVLFLNIVVGSLASNSENWGYLNLLIIIALLVSVPVVLIPMLVSGCVASTGLAKGSWLHRGAIVSLASMVLMAIFIRFFSRWALTDTYSSIPFWGLVGFVVGASIRKKKTPTEQQNGPSDRAGSPSGTITDN